MRKPMLLFAAALLASCVWVSAAAQTAAPPVSQDPVARSKDTNTIRALLVPSVEATLSSQIAAQVSKITVEDGARFEQGQSLIQFDCDMHRAELSKANAGLRVATQTHAANQRLKKHQAISNLEVEISGAKLDSARAETALMRAQVKRCDVKAPFSGRVVKVLVKPYESVTAGQALIAILDDSRLKVELYVPSSWLVWLKPNQEFTITIDETGKTYPARVKAVGARVDAVSQTLELSAEVAESYPELLSGMSGTAHFDVPQ